MTSKYNQNFNLYTKIEEKKNLEANKTKYNLSGGFDRKSFLEKCFLMTFFFETSHDDNKPYFSAN